MAVNSRSEAAQNWVTLASGMLGQGNTAPIKMPIEPVAIPPEIQQRLADIPVDDSLGATHGAYEIYRITGFDFVADKHWKTTVYRKAKIIGPQGVERYRSLSVTFNSLFERVYVNRLAVYDETGALAAEGNPNDYYVVDNADGEMATGEQTLHIPAPMIKPGYTLEYELTRELLVGLDSFGFERVVLAASLPTQVAAVFVVGDVDKLAFTSTGPEAREGASGPLRYWGVSNPPLFAYESGQPAIEGFSPIVHLSDAGRTWQELGAKYCEKIADRLQPDAAATERAVQLTAGLATREEKIAAIARFVQKEINYQALEFGVRGQMPNAPSRTLQTAYGDCKDHSLLAKQILDAVGIPAQLALVHSANLTDRQLPSQDQFDHMILSVAGPAGGDEGRVFLDCTSKHHHPGFVIFSDAETAINEALLLDPANSRLVGIPCRQADWVELRCSREVTIACDQPELQAADAVVREQVCFSPVAAGGMRAGLSATEPREHKSVITEMLRDQEKIRLTALSIENLEEPALPLVLNLEYRVESVFHKIDGDGGKFVGRLPAVWESWLANDDDSAELVTPFQRQGATLRSTARVVLPPGYVASRAFKPQRSPEQNRFVAWTLDGDPAAHSRNLTIQSFPGVFPATDYALSCREMKQLTDFLQKPITIEPAAR
ncbi:MAG: DUF3857 domain-containing protein [Pirellulales bacterium]|nr:DUF3857 domain-containing protein [Pirellulales bacterium]